MIQIGRPNETGKLTFNLSRMELIYRKVNYSNLLDYEGFHIHVKFDISPFERRKFRSIRFIVVIEFHTGLTTVWSGGIHGMYNLCSLENGGAFAG